MIAILKREFKSYFLSMTGYGFAACLLLFSGIYTMAVCLAGYYSNFEYVLGNVSFIFLLIVPILTMRVFAEEKKQKTDQLLYSLPAGMGRIVLGKYLALLAVFLVPVGIMCFYPLILQAFGTLSFKVIYGSFFAFFLLGAALISIGMFISTLTESQPLAAGLTFLILLVNYLASNLAGYLPVGGDFFAKLSLFDVLDNFIYGVFDINGIIFYLTTIGVFIFLTVQSLEKRRWC